jgi:tRNA(Phe) wybutosine-synthesizing methylase Tyw3
MATTKFPDGVATTHCPIEDCSGRIEVELQMGATRREGKRIIFDVHPSGFKLLDEHNHPDPWMERGPRVER